MIGNQIANFRIVDKLGEGGMGVVFRAVDVQLDRPVAIKMLNADLARDPQVVERFRTEARAQANLNHVNLATLYAFLVDQGNAFMVMEFVEGETFEQIISRRGPIPPEDAVPWFKQALLGIGAAHRMGIIHRDIKPSNLMLNRQGIVKVMDFGIAKVVGTRGMTRTGMQLGTLPYMSPEQIQNRNVDVRTDIYALGITLYQMLSGHVPFESDSDFEIMNGHITAPPPPLTRMYPYAPVQYENVVMKALEKNPDNRYQTVEQFGAALEHPEGVPALAGAAPIPPGVRPTIIEMPRPLVAGSAALAATAPAFATPTPAAQASPATAPQAQPVPAAPVPLAPAVAASPATGKLAWNSRYTAAAAIAVAALILLAVLMFARKPPVAQAPAVVGPAPAASTDSPLASQQAEVTVTGQNPLGSSPSSQSPGQGSTAAPPASGPSASPPPQHPAKPHKTANPDRAEIDEVEHEVDQLTSRAAAVNNSLDRLQRQQAAAGYGLRGDIVSRQASMQTNLSKAQSAVQSGDVARAKRYANLAAADLEVLEKFLGR